MKHETDVYQGFLSGAGFLGAVSITALVLVLSFPSKFEVNDWYFSGILSLLAIASSGSVIASFFAIIEWETDFGEEFRRAIRGLTATVWSISLVALLIVIPMVLASVSSFATTVVALLEVICVLVYVRIVLKVRAHKKAST